MHLARGSGMTRDWRCRCGFHRWGELRTLRPTDKVPLLLVSFLEKLVVTKRTCQRCGEERWHFRQVQT